MTYQQLSKRYHVPVHIIRDMVRHIRESPRGRLSKRDQERLIELLNDKFYDFEPEVNDYESPFDNLR